ncbi:sigma 54-interacting transcriptional regulator [Pyxidicoccus parkwayensis]|uniref:sigma 54-interacting transcriptional regulator n=1 Tax=Pyxidicoccus parkwayensis TaxID=2813578 RepID=UPI001F50B582|nr:sigma 54-interacting transcriptional regulator [Pyxidicoccus parkwaysis]
MVVLAPSDVHAAATLIASARQDGTERVLAVVLTQAQVPAETSWVLLSEGATDVVAWSGGPVDVIVARLERWRAVEALLRQPVVQDTAVGHSPAWTALLRQVVEVAAFTDASMLLLGESGTGKELLARLVHALDTRMSKRELVVVDCTTLSSELAGSELFGHERGAFTGAASQREGAFSLANDGTLFLDEVGELPASLQPQFLRAVQERTFKPVGGNAWQRTRFRLVCATHRDLREQVRTGGFRNDLYHRLASWTFRLPPLRERAQDILPLARHFVRELRPEAPPPFDPAVEDFLLRRDYPGNIRELRQLVTRIVHRHIGAGPITLGAIAEQDRPMERRMTDWRDHRLESAIQHALVLGVGLKEIGRGATDVAVRLVVEQERGNLQRAARKLGVTDRALQLRRGAARDKADGLDEPM